ncbi:1976_t:CDS:1 [Acaulospora morrowiae]|uniref:1976_t:CDS:1 n=1 Tax=Acaulospora morrowiae TaxID=94023 RepID=A0A9N8YWB4_9GLOM|nr:1976_t:CDS:1 [Acaulospora morrowiae]
MTLEETKIGGRLYYFSDEWYKQFTNNPANHIIENGYFPTWNNARCPRLRKVRISSRRRIYSDESREEIKRLLSSGIISNFPVYKKCFLSKFFFKPKDDGSQRLIVNLKKLNKHIRPLYSPPMDRIKDVISVLNRGDLMFSIDIKEAFHHIPVHPDARKYFVFDFDGRRYCYECLPFGLKTSPAVFSFIFRLAVNLAKTSGIHIFVYLDEILFIAGSLQEAVERRNFIIHKLELLGFVLNYDKSHINPSTEIKHLGFIIDSHNMRVYVPEEKVDKLMAECENFYELIKKKRARKRELLSIVGKIRSIYIAFSPALKYARKLNALFYRRGYSHIRKTRKILYLLSSLIYTLKRKNWRSIRQINADERI